MCCLEAGWFVQLVQSLTRRLGLQVEHAPVVWLKLFLWSECTQSVCLCCLHWPPYQMRELVQIAEVKPAVLQANSGVLLWGLRGFRGSCCCIPAELPAVCPALQQALWHPSLSNPPNLAILPSPADLLSQNRELQAFCRRHGIQFQAYSSLGGQYLMRSVGAAVCCSVVHAAQSNGPALAAAWEGST